MKLQITHYSCDGSGGAAVAHATIVGERQVEVTLYGEDASWEHLTENLEAIYAEKVAEIERIERHERYMENIEDYMDAQDAAICELFEMLIGGDDDDSE